MMKKILNIRLSYLYPTLFVLFFLALTRFTPTKLTAGQLALYSVNTFLFGFYFSPLLSAQKGRVDELLHFTKQEKYKDNSVMNVIYERVAKTQENRDTIQNVSLNRVYSHEWLVTLVLFGITLYFVMQTDYGSVIFFRALLAVLCTGLSLMIIILAKYATLTHKQAKRMWTPLKQLRTDHFEDITADEIKDMRAYVAKQRD